MPNPQNRKTGPEQSFRSAKDIVWVVDPLTNEIVRQDTERAVQCFLDAGGTPRDIRPVPGLALNLPGGFAFGDFLVPYTSGATYNPIGTYIIRVPNTPEELLGQIERAQQLQDLNTFFDGLDIRNPKNNPYSI